MKKILFTLVCALSSLMAVAATSITCTGYVSNYSGGEYMYALTSDQGNWYVVYYLQIEKDALENGKTYTAAQLQESYANYLANPNNPSATPTTHTFTDCTLTITVDQESKTGVILGTFTSAKDGQDYEIRYEGAINEETKDPGNPGGPIETSMEDDATTDLFLSKALPVSLVMPYMQPMISDKEIELRAYDLDGNYEVSLVFNVGIENFDSETYVPTGTYTISDSGELGTVLAGKGHTLDNTTCIGSYVAQLSGEKVVNRWYPTSGKVIVGKDSEGQLYVVLSAKNSLSHSVELTIGDAPASAGVVAISTLWKKYYPALHYWSVVLTTAANEDARYSLDVTAPATMVENTSYTATGGFVTAGGDYIAVSTGTYKEYHNAAGDYYVEASLELTNGETHNVRYVERAVPVATDTIAVSMTDATLRHAATSMDDPVIVFAGKDNKYDISLSFMGEQVKPTYSLADVYAYYTHLSVSGKDVPVRDLSAKAEQHETGFSISAYVLGEDAHCYQVSLSYELPEAKDTTVLNSTNMLIDESHINQLGEIVFSASDKTLNKAVELWIYTGEVPGSYHGEDFDYAYSAIVDLQTEASKRIIYGSVVVTTKNNVTSVIGGVLTEDAHYYKLNLTYTRPEKPTREITLVMEDAVVDITRLSEEGVLYLSGSDDDLTYQMEVMAYTAELNGEISSEQFDPYYTFLKSLDSNHQQKDIFDFLEGTATVTLADDVLTLKADIFVQSEENPADAPMVHLTMVAYCETGRALDNSEEDFYALLDQYVVNTDYFEESGVVLLDAANSDTTQMLALTFYTTGVNKRFGVPLGTYEISSTTMPGTVAIAPESQDGKLYPSFAAYTYENGEPKVPLWYLMEGTVTVSEVDGELAIVVDALNSFHREIHVAVGAATVDTVEIDMNDCELADYEQSFQFLGQNLKWEAFVAINHKLATGTYTWDDAIADYCHVRTINGPYTTAARLTATVTEARNGYDCDAYLTCTNAVCYHIVFHYYHPEPVEKPFETVRIEATNLTFDNVWAADGYWIYDASNDSLTVTITAKVSDPLEFAEPDDLNYEFTYITNKATGSILRCYSGETSFVAVATQDDALCYYALTGYLLGHDGVLYHLWLDASQPQGITSIPAQQKATKLLINGQLVIEVEGRRFDVLGKTINL